MDDNIEKTESVKEPSGRVRYLSVRTVASYVLMLGCFFLVIILYVPENGIGRENPFCLGLILILLALVCFLVWLLILRPYGKCEYELHRLIEGYLTIEAPGEAKSTFISPAVYEAEQSIFRILNSPQTMKLNKRQAQYLALQNQINPHFLYNTLDGIRSEALIAGLENVADMTEALATFFRYTISNVENLVTVEQELDNCRNYFKIQQYRFGDRLRLQILTEEDCGLCLLPKLTLQPILENSIIHGTEMKLGAGLTAIRIRRTDLRLLIEVKDDGVGIDEEMLELMNRKLDSGIEEYRSEDKGSGGIALVNVNNRIRLLFGQDYGIHIYSLKNVGTTVEVSLPAVTEESKLLRKDKPDGK